MYKLTGDTPIKLRSIPEPKYKAMASVMPIPEANRRAEETEGSLIFFPVMCPF